MKQNTPITLFIFGLTIWVATTAAGAAESNLKSDAHRKEFIGNFKRIGLNTTPGDAMLLQILVESARCKRGVEVGTATGYGAIHMGIAFERNGGHLDTIDIDPDMVSTARKNLKSVGLENIVTVIEGDALKELPKLTGDYDFVFLDALKQDYMKYFQAILPRLKPGAVIVADNVIRSGDQMRDFLGFMEKSPDYDMTIIRASMEKNDGMAVIYKIH